jgi:hypothetical protein
VVRCWNLQPLLPPLQVTQWEVWGLERVQMSAPTFGMCASRDFSDRRTIAGVTDEEITMVENLDHE